MESLLSTLSAGLAGSVGLALTASFLWGVASLLLSPCHLASIPLVIAYVAGDSSTSTRRAAALATVFAVGLLAAVAAVGILTYSAGRLAGDLGPWTSYVVAGLFLLAGLVLLDVVPLNWASPSSLWAKGRGVTGAATLGFMFGAVLGPCTFAYLAPVLGVAFAAGAQGRATGLSLVAAFAIGHALPLILVGAATSRFRRTIMAIGQARAATIWKYSMGVVLIVGGLYLLYVA